MPEQGSEYIYIKFDGPHVQHGKVDLGQAGKTLISFNRWFKRYKREFLSTDEEILLRAGAIRQGSSEIQIFLDFLQTGWGHAGEASLIAGSILKHTGISEFTKQFMGTYGQQLALKKFSKGDKISDGKRFIDKGEPKVEVGNVDGGRLIVPTNELEVYRKTGSSLNGFCNLEEGKEERLEVGYHSGRKDHAVAELTYHDTPAFQDWSDPEEWARRLNEPFDESKASEVQLIGRFVDFHGLAYKYHFSFQVRKQPDVFGKQKILCIVEPDVIEDVIERLKPSNQRNTCIKGMATKDREGKLDKIKIEWISDDPSYNPNQTSIGD